MLQPPVKVARATLSLVVLIDSDGSDSSPIGTFHSEPSVTGCPPDWIRLNHQLEHS